MNENWIQRAGKRLSRIGHLVEVYGRYGHRNLWRGTKRWHRMVTILRYAVNDRPATSSEEGWNTIYCVLSSSARGEKVFFYSNPFGFGYEDYATTAKTWHEFHAPADGKELGGEKP